MRKILILLLLFVYSFSAIVENRVLEPEEAFEVKFVQNQDSLNIKLNLGKDIYLYDDKLQINITKPQKIELLSELSIPKAIPYEEFMVHFDSLNIDISYDLLKSKLNSNRYEIEIKFQGCSKAGLCYAPMSEKFLLNFEDIKKEQIISIQDEIKPNLNDTLSETDTIALELKNSSTILTLITFFGFGLLLSFTPCVFPMIPILSSIIVKASQNEELSAKKGLFLSLVYVLSMSFAYAIAGVIAGLFGANLQASLQNPYVLISFALIFVLLALSMFGYFEIKLPNSIQTKINKTSEGKEQQGVIGIAIMGFLSALIVGPCVAPPLAGALVYIGQTGDAILGAMALFVMSLGMGVPLLLIGAGAGKFMPKSGSWMQEVTKIFGLIMLAVAIWLLSRVINPLITMYLWALLLLASAIYLRVYTYILIKLLSTILFILGVIIFVGAVSEATNPLRPLEKFTTSNTKISESESLSFVKIKNLKELEEAISTSNKPVMLDFWATWCVSCKELDEITFKDEEVVKRLKDFTLLKADVTQNSSDDKALQKKFGVVGPPAIIFWNNKKEEIVAARVVGYKNPKEFLDILNRHFSN